MITARIIADSTCNGHRLTTVDVCLPRFLLAELNTHRMFSRNSASSRAIPVRRRIRDVLARPFVPEAFGANKAGMQAGGPIGALRATFAAGVWWVALYAAVGCAYLLSVAGVHKQWANRLLEPFAYTTVIVSATEWANFFAQRLHPDAQPEMQQVARAIFDAMEASVPRTLREGEWHLPYVQPDETWRPVEERIRLSVARCARVSYLTHDGKRSAEADFALYARLVEGRHLSPFEHAARAGGTWGNFRGWTQARAGVDGSSGGMESVGATMGFLPL
jgi:thymidylate synthase ThyX